MVSSSTDETHPDAGVRAYFRALGAGRYAPTIHAQGTWRTDEQHMACVAGLAVHALELHARQEERRGLQIARISYDIYGQIPLEELQVQVRILRPGRTIELAEVRLEAAERIVVSARVWRLARTDSSAVVVDHAPAMPDRRQLPAGTGMSRWPGGYIESLELRAAHERRPGTGQSWLRSTVGLVDGEPVSELAQLMCLVDTANGINPALDPRAWAFPNTDLSVHLFRLPKGRWLGLDVDASVGPAGVGLTSATLHDELGAFGRSEQILTLRPLS